MNFSIALYHQKEKKFLFGQQERSQELHEHKLFIRPLWVGICGSDLVAIETGLLDTLSLGHEWVGEVVQVGAKVTRFKAGDIVTSPVHIKCGYCENCLNQQPDCKNQYDLSVNAGMLRTMAELPEASLVKLPKDVTAATTLLEIFAVAENVHTKLASHLEKDQTILVMGAGTLGLSTALVLKHYGYDVKMVEVIKSRMQRARKLGLECFHLGQMLLDPAQKGSYSVIIDASGDHLGGKGGWSYLDHFGKKTFLGVILAKYIHGVNFNPVTYFVKNATLKWIQGCTPESIKLAIENWNSRIDELGQDMITHVFEYANVNEAFDQARDRENAGRVIIKVQEKNR